MRQDRIRDDKRNLMRLLAKWENNGVRGRHFTGEGK
jgi:hypothetical protein